LLEGDESAEYLGSVRVTTVKRCIKLATDETAEEVPAGTNSIHLDDNAANQVWII
jgi:hypothetical protein